MEFIQSEIGLIVTIVIAFISAILGITVGIIAPLIRSKFEYLNQRVTKLEDSVSKTNDQMFSKMNETVNCVHNIQADIKVPKYVSKVNGNHKE